MSRQSHVLIYNKIISNFSTNKAVLIIFFLISHLVSAATHMTSMVQSIWSRVEQSGAGPEQTT